MEVGVDGVALITIATRPVNVLHPISKQSTNASFLIVQLCRDFPFGAVSFLRSDDVVLPNLTCSYRWAQGQVHLVTFTDRQCLLAPLIHVSMDQY